MFSFVQDAFKRSKELSDGQTWVPISVQKSQVLNREQEEHVVQYAITIAQMFYGLPVQEFRRVVYSYAVACEVRPYLRHGRGKRQLHTIGIVHSCAAIQS